MSPDDWFGLVATWLLGAVLIGVHLRSITRKRRWAGVKRDRRNSWRDRS